LHFVPIYEYRCPNGHTFERFQSMTAPAPEQCDVCGASPVELVLYPVAIHYKGSGFYSTDYGKGAKKKEGAEAGGGESKSETKTDAKPDSKPAEAASKPKPAASGD
jgi:putative FmdB family regulatory protein